MVTSRAFHRTAERIAALRGRALCAPSQPHHGATTCSISSLRHQPVRCVGRPVCCWRHAWQFMPAAQAQMALRRLGGMRERRFANSSVMLSAPPMPTAAPLPWATRPAVARSPTSPGRPDRPTRRRWPPPPSGTPASARRRTSSREWCRTARLSAIPGHAVRCRAATVRVRAAPQPARKAAVARCDVASLVFRRTDRREKFAGCSAWAWHDQ